MWQESEHIEVDDKIHVTIPDQVDDARKEYGRNVVFHRAVQMVAEYLNIESTFGITGLLYTQGGNTWTFTPEELGL